MSARGYIADYCQDEDGKAERKSRKKWSRRSRRQQERQEIRRELEDCTAEEGFACSGGENEEPSDDSQQ